MKTITKELIISSVFSKFHLETSLKKFLFKKSTLILYLMGTSRFIRILSKSINIIIIIISIFLYFIFLCRKDKVNGKWKFHTEFAVMFFWSWPTFNVYHDLLSSFKSCFSVLCLASCGQNWYCWQFLLWFNLYIVRKNTKIIYGIHII